MIEILRPASSMADFDMQPAKRARLIHPVPRGQATSEPASSHFAPFPTPDYAPQSPDTCMFATPLFNASAKNLPTLPSPHQPSPELAGPQRSFNHVGNELLARPAGQPTLHHWFPSTSMQMDSPPRRPQEPARNNSRSPARQLQLSFDPQNPLRCVSREDVAMPLCEPPRGALDVTQQIRSIIDDAGSRCEFCEQSVSSGPSADITLGQCVICNGWFCPCCATCTPLTMAIDGVICLSCYRNF